ncbi:hypothetical protein [Peptoniphilus sp.]|nr:hypothetical protein [Peptoniphilus sp.]
MDNNFDVAIEYSDNQADWDDFISLMVGKFKQWQKEKESRDD